MDRLRRSLKAYPALLRIGMAEAVAYRAEMIVWMLTTTMPLVNMALWSTVARDRRIGPEGFSSADFVAYFLLCLIVRLLTGSWVLWEMNQEIRTGVMSQRLLKPVHPLIAYSAENLAAVPLRGLLVLPISLLLLFVFSRARLTTDPVFIAAAILSLPGAWALTFLSMAFCGALAFFIDSSLALFQVWMGTYMIFSGYIVPLSLLPFGLDRAAEVLPFRYMLEFPVKLLLGFPQADGTAGTHGQALMHLGIEYAYVALMVLLVGVTWRAGLRRYAAFGA
jgi:ABC-2 type transport system permease protein